MRHAGVPLNEWPASRRSEFCTPDAITQIKRSRFNDMSDIIKRGGDTRLAFQYGNSFYGDSPLALIGAVCGVAFNGEFKVVLEERYEGSVKSIE